MLRLEPSAESEVDLYHAPGIVGIDEAGRGPLAGPVVVAAVMLPDHFDCRGLGDSKALTPAARAEQADRLKGGSYYSIAIIDEQEIDRINILQATLLGMRQALETLKVKPAEVLIDGDKIPDGLSVRAQCVVKGDAKVAAIAAASILAKTTRDALMVDHAVRYPRYGFHSHFGYATPEHLAALREFGPCPLHRRSFSPIKEMLAQPCLSLDG